METISYSNSPYYNYAGFWLRFAAYLIDYIIIGIGNIVLTIPAIAAIVWISGGFDRVEDLKEIFKDNNLQNFSLIIGIITLLSLFSFVFKWLYYALFESSKYNGTFGKIAVGIRVLDYQGNGISFGRASGRYFARIITNLTLLIGYIMAGFTEQKQALHDMVAGCIVVKRD
jgi:uncharacterized RDD family membrane protein YckC